MNDSIYSILCPTECIFVLLFKHVLPFSRRVININLPWLIKEREQHASTMINHGKGHNIKVDVNPQKEEEEEETNNKFLHIVDRR